MGRTRVRINLRTNQMVRLVERQTEEALQDIGDDLANMASQAAPIDKGILEGSHEVKKFERSGNKVIRVTFSVKEGKFNYAWHIHENLVTPSAKTRAKGMAQSGITGKTFKPGGNFLKGPFDLNKDGYLKYVEKQIKDSLH